MTEEWHFQNISKNGKQELEVEGKGNAHQTDDWMTWNFQRTTGGGGGEEETA